LNQYFFCRNPLESDTINTRTCVSHIN
jgi:hypothetical protein